MPKVKSTIEVNFPQWANYSEEVKSLLNFFMYNASAFFTTHQDQTVSGNVRLTKNSLVSVGSSFADSITLDIPYSNSFPSTATNYLPDTQTVIVPQSTTTRLCKLTPSTASLFPTGISIIDSLACTITPKINGLPNTNLNYVPYNNTQTKIVSSNGEFISDYSLRTSSFYINDNDVFYKVGVFSLDQRYPYSFTGNPLPQTVDLISLLKENTLTLNTSIHAEYAYSLLQSNLIVEKENHQYGFTTNALLPLIDAEQYIIALVYFQLFHQDGTLYTSTPQSTTLYCRPAINENPVEVMMGDGYGLNLTLTDQFIDSGYIQTSFTPSPFPAITQTTISKQSPISVQEEETIDTEIEYDATSLYLISTRDNNQFSTYFGWEGVEGDPLPPVPELPTVSLSGDFGSDNWLFANTGGTNVSILAGNSILVGTGGSLVPSPVSYDTGKQYAVIYWATYQSSQGSGYTEYAIINNSGRIYAKNVTSGNLYLYAIRIAVCSSNQATVVIVYDSQSTAYNAFKYTLNNIDYYYVFDGTQVNWTDDLSSIDYSLTKNIPRGYFNQNKMNQYLGDYSSTPMYDSSGNPLRGDSTKTYTILNWYLEDGTLASVGSNFYILVMYDDSLYMKSSGSRGTAAYVEYSVE